MGEKRQFKTANYPPVYRIVLLQLGLTLSFAAIAYWVQPAKLWPALYGGGICCVANALYAWWCFRANPDSTPAGLLRVAYWGEALKIFVTISLFGVVMGTGMVAGAENVLVLFGCYFFGQLAYWAAPLLIK